MNQIGRGLATVGIWAGVAAITLLAEDLSKVEGLFLCATVGTMAVWWKS